MHLLFGPAPTLADWEGRPPGATEPVPGCHRDRYARVVAVEAPGLPVPGGPFGRVAAALSVYDVFPPRIGQGVIRRPVQVGDTVGLLYRFAPGLTIFFASRVVDVFHEPCRSGFTYRTLRGHPELGEETFCVEKDAATGEVTASLASWSVPGHPLVRLLKPLARWMQRRANLAALDHLQFRSLSEPPGRLEA